MLNPTRVIILRFLAITCAVVIVAGIIGAVGSFLGVPSAVGAIIGFAIGFGAVMLTQSWWLCA